MSWSNQIAQTLKHLIQLLLELLEMLAQCNKLINKANKAKYIMKMIIICRDLK